MTPQLQFIDVLDLAPLAELAEVFPDKPEADYQALKLAIALAGEVSEPLTVLGDGRTICKGRNRLRAATELFKEGRTEFKTVPCLVRPTNDPIFDAWQEELTARHWTATQRAFVGFNLNREAILERYGRGQSHPAKKYGADSCELTIEEIADGCGCSEPYLRQFAELWHEYHHKWDRVFKLVWYGNEKDNTPVKLNRMRPALEGQETPTGGKAAAKWYHSTENGQLELSLGIIPRSVTSLKGAFDHWKKEALSTAEMAAFEADWLALLAEMPPRLEKVTVERFVARGGRK